MTVPASAQKAGPFNCNGVVDAFDFEFKVFATSDVRVVRTTAAGVESTLTLVTDYTVSLNGDQDADPGGSITTTSVYADGKITLVSNLSEAQPTVLTNAGGFYPKVVERSLDRLAILIKQMREKLDRAVTVDVSSGVDPADLLDSIDDSVAAAAASEAAAAASETAAGLSETAAAASEVAAEASAAVAAAAGVIALTSVAGTNTITASAAGVTSYDTGRPFTFVPANTNGGATTLNVNALGAKNVYANGAACVGGELVAGVPYVVVYDGTRFGVTGPYVLLDGAVTIAKIDDEAVTVAKLDDAAASGVKNYIINGGCQIAQTGSVTVTPADNVFIVGGTDMAASACTNRTSMAVNNAANSGMVTGFAHQITLTSSAAGVVNGAFRIEAADAVALNGKQVTFACKGYQNSGGSLQARLRIRKPSASNDFTTLTTISTGSDFTVADSTVVPASLTVTLGASDATDGLQVEIEYTTAAGVTGKVFQLGDVRLVEGSVAPPFVAEPGQVTLAKCQRRFWRSNTGSGIGLPNWAAYIASASGGSYETISFPVTMPGQPTMTMGPGAWSGTNVAVPPTIAGQSTDGFTLLILHAGVGAASLSPASGDCWIQADLRLK